MFSRLRALLLAAGVGMVGAENLVQLACPGLGPVLPEAPISSIRRIASRQDKPWERGTREGVKLSERTQWAWKSPPGKADPPPEASFA